MPSPGGPPFFEKKGAKKLYAVGRVCSSITVLAMMDVIIFVIWHKVFLVTSFSKEVTPARRARRL